MKMKELPYYMFSHLAGDEFSELDSRLFFSQRHKRLYRKAHGSESADLKSKSVCAQSVVAHRSRHTGCA